MEQSNKTKNLIIEIAKQEFLEKGYVHASLRTITQKAGVTTGSFYWHFKDKEDLFGQIVEESYLRILNMYDEAASYYENLEVRDQKSSMGDVGEICMLKMLDYIYERKDVFLILLLCSKGTAYENLIHELTKREIETTKQAMSTLGVSTEKISNRMYEIIISGMFSAIFELITQDVTLEEAKSSCMELHRFYTAGWKYLMNL